MPQSPPLSIAVIVVAAGRGRRFGGDLPKQYQPLPNGRTVLGTTLHALTTHPALTDLLCMIHPDDADLFAQASAGVNGAVATVAGGDSRAASVLNGLKALAERPSPPEIVLIHDGARPFVRPALIDALLTALTPPGVTGALPALPITDSIKRASPADTGELPDIRESVPRDGLWRVQTPQAFRFAPLLAAYAALEDFDAATDDAWVLEHHGTATGRVVLVPGDAANLKITRPEDMMIPPQPAPADIRTGSGFDAHRFGTAADLPLMLCGVEVPHEAGLAGHSDADVALHAITDALLGAVAAGDIGQHFPPSDPQWRGASSDRFVQHAMALLSTAGGTLLHLDVTLICEAPKVGPYRETMAARVAALTGLEPGRVNIKATTTEGMGFTGRREGIAAQAVATVRIG